MPAGDARVSFEKGSLSSARLVVFDVAGTTVHLSIDIAKTFADTFSFFGISVKRDTIQQYRGASKREAVERILNEHRADVEAGAVYNEFQERLQRGLENGGVVTVPGAADVFATLRAAGIQVALATGFDSRSARYVLECMAWAQRIDCMISADDVAAGRPAPDMIQSAMQRVAVHDPMDVVVIGDTVNDIEAGRRAGVAVVLGVLTGAHDEERLVSAGPTAILQSVADLPRWLGLATIQS